MLAAFDFPGTAVILLVVITLGWIISIFGLPLALKGRSVCGLGLAQLGSLCTLLCFYAGLSPWVVTTIVLTLTMLGDFSQWAKKKNSDQIFLIIYIISLALSTLLLSLSPTGESDFMSNQFGNILSIQKRDGWVVGTLSLIGLASIFLLFKPYLSFAADPGFSTYSKKTKYLISIVWNIVFSLTLSFGIYYLGVIVAFGYLVLPALTTFGMSSRIYLWPWLHLIITGAITLLSYSLAFYFDLPPGPTITSLMVTSYLLLKILLWMMNKTA